MPDASAPSSRTDSGSGDAQHDHTGVNATIYPPPLPELSRRIVTGVDIDTGESKVQIDDRGGYIQYVCMYDAKFISLILHVTVRSQMTSTGKFSG